MEVSFTEGEEENVYEELARLEGVGGYLACSILRMDLHGNANMNSVNLYSFGDVEHFSGFWDFHKEQVPFPEQGNVIVSSRVAERLSLSPGDRPEKQNADRH